MFHSVRHAHSFQRFGHPLLAVRRVHAAISQGQFDVLEHGQVADEIEALEDEPHLAVADARPLRVVEIRDGLVVECVTAFGRRIEQAED